MTNNKKYRDTKTNIVTFIKTLRLKNDLKDSKGSDVIPITIGALTDEAR